MDKNPLRVKDCFEPDSDLPVILEETDGSQLNIDNTKFYKNVFATDDSLIQSPNSIANSSLFSSSVSRFVLRFDSDSTDIYPLALNPAQSSTILSQSSVALTDTLMLQPSNSSIYFDEPDDKPISKYIENLVRDIPQEDFSASRGNLVARKEDKSKLQSTLFNFSINPLLPIDQQDLGVFSTVIATGLVNSAYGSISSAPFVYKEPHSYFSSINPFNKINQDIPDATMLSENHQTPFKRRQFDHYGPLFKSLDDDSEPSIVFLRKNIGDGGRGGEYEILKIDDDHKLLDLIKNYPIRRFKENEDLNLRDFKLDFKFFFRRYSAEKITSPLTIEEMKLHDNKSKLFKNSFFGILAIIIINELMIKSFDEIDLANTDAFSTHYNLSDVCRQRNYKDIELENTIFDNFKKVVCSFQKYYPKKILIHNFREKQFMDDDLEKLELKDICRKALISIKTVIESKLLYSQKGALKIDKLDLLYFRELTDISLKTYDKLNQKPSAKIVLMGSEKIYSYGPARRGL
jgi:hypothetical protein